MNSRKTILTGLVILSLVLLSTGCGSAATSTSPTTTERKPGTLDFPLQDYSVPSIYPDNMNEVVDFKFHTDREAYPTDTQAIKFTIENLTDVDRMTGAPYALETWQVSAWHSVPYNKLPDDLTRAWPAIAYFVPAKDRWTGSINLSEYDPLKPGRYRIVKEVMSIQSSDGFSIFISTEFEIGSLTESNPNLISGIPSPICSTT